MKLHLFATGNIRLRDIVSINPLVTDCGSQRLSYKAAG